MRIPWTNLKSSEDEDKAAQREQGDVVDPFDDLVDDEHFESDWDDLKKKILTEDGIWRSSPKSVSDGMDYQTGIRLSSISLIIRSISTRRSSRKPLRHPGQIRYPRCFRGGDVTHWRCRQISNIDRTIIACTY